MNTPDATPEANRKKRKKAAKRMPANAAIRKEAHAAVLPAALPSLQRDDLTAIEGIDPTMEMALNSIGIRQFSDFRGHTPEALAHALQARGVDSITPEKIAEQDWMGWAEILAAENLSAPVPASEKRETPTEANKESDSSEPLAQAPKTEEPHSPFAPEVQHENGKTPQAENSSPQEEKSSPVEVALHIHNVRFAQIETTATALQPSAPRLRCEMQCELTGPHAVGRTLEQDHLCTQIHAIDMLTGTHLLLASQSQRLRVDQTDYSATLECKTPEAGRYQSFVIAFLLQSNPPIAFYQGPALRVIP